VFAPLNPHLLDLAGPTAIRNVGDPIQYDELRIEHDHGEVEIIVYNRAILTHPSLDAPRAPGRARCSRPTARW